MIVRMTLRGTAELDQDTGALALAQLDRILSSATFRRADRLKRFLSFIVQETMGGRGEKLPFLEPTAKRRAALEPQLPKRQSRHRRPEPIADPATG